MPRTPRRRIGTRPYRNYTDESLNEALKCIKAKTLSIRQASLKFGIPKNTLHLKSQGKHTNSVGRVSVLTKEEELKLVGHIIAMSNYGFPVDVFDLRCVVKSYLDRCGRKEVRFKNNFPGKDWAEGFMERHEAVLTQRTVKNISHSRAATDEQKLNDYFDNLEKELDGIPPTHIYNYDETNLVDDPGAGKIITKRGCKYPERIQNSSKACTSIMVCGNAAGDIVPPYVNYKAEKIWTTWTENGPSGARYNRTKSGWFDGNTFEDWFKSLMLPILKRQDGPKALIGDNLSSHINIEVLRLCTENNIKFIALPPNTTHLLQPLDVAYFRPMKGAWRKVLKQWKETAAGSRCTSVPKDQFPTLLKKLWDSLHTGPDNLIAGFRKSGIYPINRQPVLQRLPSRSLDPSVSSVVGETFIEQITKKREEATASRRQTNRRKKLNVPPGKSFSADDIETVAPTESAPSTSKGRRGRQQVSQPKRPRRESSSSSSSDESTDISLQDTDGSDILNEEFSDFHDEPSPSISSVQPENTSSPTLQNLTVGQYVLVNYEGELYPGQITHMKNSNEILINAMQKSGVHWKWPAKHDEIYYSKDEIVRVITPPEQINRRGIYSVIELGDYNELSNV